MAGYGGQTVALDAMTPSQLQQQAAAASLASTQSQLASQTLPDEVALRKAQAENAQQVNQSGALKLEQDMGEWGIRKAMAARIEQANAMGKSPLAAGSAGSSPLDSAQGDGTPQASPQTPLFSPQVDQVMHSIDPDDPEAGQKWDAQMSALAKTDPSASQFVGKYSESNLNGWLTQIGSNAVAQAGKGPASPLAPPQAGGSPLAAPAQGNAAAQPAQKQGVISPLTGTEDPELTKFAALYPAQAAAYVKQMGMLQYTRTGNQAYLKRYDPDEYDKLVTAQKNLNEGQKTAIETKATEMGSSAAAFLQVAKQFGVNSPQARGAWTRSITDAANNGMMQPQIAQQWLAHGPDVGFATESMIRAQTVSQFMKSSGIEAANEQAAKVNNPEPNYTANQVDADGKLIITNAHPAPGQPVLTPTNIQAGAKPSAGMMTLQAKTQMLIGAGVDAREAALMVAGTKPMDPAKVQIAARNAALREQQNAALTGQNVDVNALTQQFAQEFTAAGANPYSGTAPAADTGPRTVSGHTPVQAQLAKAFVAGKPLPGIGVKFDKSARLGTPANPHFPRSKQDYDRIRKGEMYVDQMGIPRTKA